MKQISCWIFGHAMRLTGRKTIALFQVHCATCDRYFIGNLDDMNGGLLPWDIHWEAYFQEKGK